MITRIMLQGVLTFGIACLCLSIGFKEGSKHVAQCPPNPYITDTIQVIPQMLPNEVGVFCRNGADPTWRLVENDLLIVGCGK